MVRAGIITFHESPNYGAVLQAYALQTVILNLGHHAEIIDYRNPRRGLAEKSQLALLKHIVWRNIAHLFVGPTRSLRTECFRQQNMNLSKKKYSDPTHLQQEPPDEDVYITGSDQVWGSWIVRKDPSFLLSFVPDGKYKASYAASFGTDEISRDLAEYYRHYLNRIDNILVREETAQKIVFELTGRHADIVLDPTLLLTAEEWNCIAHPHLTPAKPYILCYHMRGDTAIATSLALAHAISKRTGWGVIRLGDREWVKLNPWTNCRFDDGPVEFLGLLQNASFVVTDAFHGVAFAIKHGKPFWVTRNLHGPSSRSRNDRISTLLNLTGLQNRLIPAGRISESLNCCQLDLDYTAPERLLMEKVEMSIESLKSILNGKCR